MYYSGEGFPDESSGAKNPPANGDEECGSLIPDWEDPEEGYGYLFPYILVLKSYGRWS